MKLNKNGYEKASDLRSRAEEIVRGKPSLLPEDLKVLSDEEIRRTLHEHRVYRIELEMQNDQLRQAQVKLEQLQDRYFDIFEQAPVGYIILSDEEVIVHANLTASTLLNIERGALIKQPIYKFIFKEDRDIYYLHKKHLLDTGDLQTFELRMTQKDEIIIWVHLTITAIEESDGRSVNRIILSNITDRKRAEEALQESEQKFRTLSNSGMALIWTSGTDKLCNYFNDVWIKFTGRTVQQEMGTGWTEGVYQDDLQQCLDIYTGAFDRREHFSMEYRMRRYDGKYRWILDEGCPRYDSKGEFIGYIGHCLDITERKLAEEALSREQFLMKTLLDSLPGIFFLYSYPELRLVRWNKNHETLLGFNSEEIKDRSILEWHLPEAKDAVLAAVEMVMEKGFTVIESPLLTKNGRSIPFLQTGVKIEVSGQTYLMGVGIDITKRRLAEEEVRRNESRLRILVDILQHPSDTVKDLLDYALEQAIQLTGSKIGYIYHYHEDRKEFVLNAWSKEVLPACAIVQPQTCYELAKTGIWGEAVRQRKPIIVNDFQAAHPLKKGCPEGHVQLFKFVTIPIFKGERIVSVVGLANKETDYEQTDILQVSLLMDSVWKVAESMRTEEENAKLAVQLQQAQKMEAIGTLAGGIAHDFNNILGAILGYAEMAYDDSPVDSSFRNDINQILKAGHRARELVKQILAFSRQAEAERIPLQSAVIVRETCKMLFSSLPSTIAIRQDIDPHTGIILADPTQIHQILMNLCTNAYHAMEETGGILTISLQNLMLSHEEIASDPHLQPGNFVQLSVEDTGSGIRPELLERIFEPFFTTKEVGKGTGMGLSIIHGIMKSYNGFVTCRSKLGEGTVFRVFFPVIEDMLPPDADATPTPIQAGNERILYVDDEEMLLEMNKNMLQRIGYQVTARTNGIEALRAFRNQPDSFDLVITDQTMPDMTGSDLSRAILQIRPDIPIILCTGYSSLISEETAKSFGIKGFAMKPLTKSAITALIRKVLKD